MKKLRNMKCCILVMADNRELSARNLMAINQTYINGYYLDKDSFDNEFTFYYYTGGYNNFNVVDNHIQCVSPDNIDGTFYKTIEAFNYCRKMNFDFIVRTNISTYINLRLLDKCLSLFNKDVIYCNKISTYLDDNLLNKYYPRGDAYIIHNDLLCKCLDLLEHYSPSDEYTLDDKYDDVLFGMLVLKVFGDDFVEHIKPMQYNCLLETTLHPCVKNCIFSRLKTCPPNTHSGYSWDDNEYRLYDIKKFLLLHKSFECAKDNLINDNDNISIEHLLADYDSNDYFIKLDDEMCITSLNNLILYNKQRKTK